MGSNPPFDCNADGVTEDFQAQVWRGCCRGTRRWASASRILVGPASRPGRQRPPRVPRFSIAFGQRGQVVASALPVMPTASHPCRPSSFRCLVNLANSSKRATSSDIPSACRVLRSPAFTTVGAVGHCQRSPGRGAIRTSAEQRVVADDRRGQGEEQTDASVAASPSTLFLRLLRDDQILDLVVRGFPQNLVVVRNSADAFRVCPDMSSAP